MAITTISNLPNLQTGFNRIKRADTTVANDKTQKFLGFNDLFEITLMSENPQTAAHYSRYSSQIKVSELHTQLLGKLRYVNYNTIDTLSQTVPPLMFNPTTKYYKGDRIFYIKDNSSLVRIIRYIGENGSSGSTIAPSINTVADYQTTSATINDDIENYITINNDKRFCWICENEILSNNVFPLFSPMLSMTKLLSTSWLEATTDFTSYYASTYCGIGNILSDLMLNENTKKTACTIDGTSALLFSNNTDDTVGAIDDTYNNGYISVNYTNLKALVVNAAQNSTIVEMLKRIYSNTYNPTNTIVKTAESLNFWLIIIDYSDSTDEDGYTPIDSTGSTLQLTDYAKSKIDSSNLKFAFIPPRVYNNEVLELDEKKYLYFYAGNAFSEKTTKDINLSYFLSAFLKRDCTNTITGKHFLFDKPAYSSGAVSNAAEGRVFGLSDNYSYLRIQGGGDDGTRPNGAQLRLGGYNYKGSSVPQGSFALYTANTNGSIGPTLTGYNNGLLEWKGHSIKISSDAYNWNGITLNDDKSNLTICGCTNFESGGTLVLNGKNIVTDDDSLKGAFYLKAQTGTKTYLLTGYTNGVLKWAGDTFNLGGIALKNKSGGTLNWSGNHIQFGPSSANWSSIYHNSVSSVVNICSSTSNRTGGNLRLYSNNATGSTGLYPENVRGSFELCVTDDTCGDTKQYVYKLTGDKTGTLDWSGHSIKISSDAYNWNGITLNDDKSNLTICGCTNYKSGGTLILLGKDNTASGESLKGAFYLTAQTGTKKYLLTGYTDGVLQWTGNIFRLNGNTFDLGGKTLKNNSGTLEWSDNTFNLNGITLTAAKTSSTINNTIKQSARFFLYDTSVAGNAGNVFGLSHNNSYLRIQGGGDDGTRPNGAQLRLAGCNYNVTGGTPAGAFILNTALSTGYHGPSLTGYNNGLLEWKGHVITLSSNSGWNGITSKTNNLNMNICGGVNNESGGTLILYGKDYNNPNYQSYAGGFAFRAIKAEQTNPNNVAMYYFVGHNTGVLQWTGNTFNLGGKALTVVNQKTLNFDGERVGHHIGEIFYTYRKDVLDRTIPDNNINGAYVCDGRSVEISTYDAIYILIRDNKISCRKTFDDEGINPDEYDDFKDIDNTNTTFMFYRKKVELENDSTKYEYKFLIKTPNLINKFIQSTNTGTSVGGYVAPGIPNITGFLSHYGNGYYSDVSAVGAFGAIKNTDKSGESEAYNGKRIEYTFNAVLGETKTDGILKTAADYHVYGKSDTVQPETVLLVPLIQIF